MNACRYLLFAAILAAPAGASPPDGLRFDSPRVVDLSSRGSGDVAAADVAVVALDAQAAATILAADALAEGSPQLPFANDAYGCADDDCATRAEARLIDAEHGLVARKGDVLTVRPAAGEPLRFVDYAIAATRQADGDGARHRYLGRIGSTRLMHVEVQFEHDSPGAFLIGADSGRVVFVHNGGDVAAFAPDARYLAVLNTLNTPAAIMIADLSTGGPSLALACGTRAAGSRVLVDTKGWHDANGVDVVLKRPDGDGKTTALPLRIERTHGGWRVAAPDGSLPAVFDGFSCRAAKRQQS